MKKPTEVLKIFEKYTPAVEEEIKSLLAEQGDYLMYNMMSYFFGFLNEDLKEVPYYGGKRLRPGIFLLLNDFFKTEADVTAIAAAIEIFHNFTLIHDDIADNDEVRRGRPTVWKLWGINQALNTGDAQLLLVNSAMYRFAKQYPELGLEVQKFANEKFIEVAEGQHLDFLLSELPLDDPFVNEENTFKMMAKKSGVLVGLSSACVGIIAGKSEEEIENLWQYGFNLGITYQFCDDLVSIWGSKDSTGKEEMADIREKKKTLPIVTLYNHLDAEPKSRLRDLYVKKGDLSSAEMVEVKKLLDESDIRDNVVERAKESLALVRDAINKMPTKATEKDILEKINKALFIQIEEA